MNKRFRVHRQRTLVFGLALSLGFFLLVIAEGFSAGDRHCRVCGEPVDETGAFFSVKESQEVICTHCYQSAPRCRYCKLPTAPQQMDAATGACPQCYAKLIHCRVCGKAILGIRYQFPFREGYFCPVCKKQRPACYICGAPVGNDLWRYPDGRIVCGDCGERAVFDVEEIARIMQESQFIAETSLGMKLHQPYLLKVERLNGLPASVPELRRRIFTDGSPLYGKELGLYRRVGNSSEIFLLFGLIPEQLYEASAHEFAHAWQSENSSSELSAELSEGFAQWVAAQVLRQKGFAIALERLERRNDFPYGTGYQRMKNLLQGNVRNLLR